MQVSQLVVWIFRCHFAPQVFLLDKDLLDVEDLQNSCDDGGAKGVGQAR